MFMFCLIFTHNNIIQIIEKRNKTLLVVTSGEPGIPIFLILNFGLAVRFTSKPAHVTTEVI